MTLEEFEEDGGGLILTAAVPQTPKVSLTPGVHLPVGSESYAVGTPTTDLGHLFTREPCD